MPTHESQIARASALVILQEHHPQQLKIQLREATRWMGVSSPTARRYILAGTFPIPTVRFGDLHLVDIRDLAAYLDGPALEPESSQLESEQRLTSPAVTVVPPVKRGRGRPRKIARGAA
jgi:hypothetical protein